MSKESDFFLENLSLLMHSSLPVREAVATLKEEIHGTQMLRAITIIENEIDAGSKISTALGKSKLLSERFVSLLRLGEETGELEKQLTLVVDEQKKEKRLTSKVRGALIYPAIVITVTIFVGIFVMWYVFPRLTSVFASSGSKLPASTQAIIAIGNFLTSYGIIAVPLGTLVVALSIYVFFIYKRTRFIGETLLLSLSMTRTLVQDIELARFGYVMGSLLRAGITLPQALMSMQDSTSFQLYKRFYAKVLIDVNEGHSLFKSIEAYPHAHRYIPSYLSRLISAGELSGSLSDTLLNIGQTYEEKTENLTQNLSVMLEPIIMVVVGLMVGFLAIAIITPIYGLTNQIK